MTLETTGLPPAIQAQVAQAEALHAQVYTPAAPEGNTDEGAPPTTAPEPAEQPTVVPAQQPPQDEGYKARFDVLQGKYNAEVPRLHQANRELQQQLQQVAQQLAELNHRPEPEAKPEPQKKLVTDKDVETFGEDMLDVVRRTFHQEAQALLPQIIAQLRGEFQPAMAQVDQVAQRQALSEEERFWSAIRTAVPDWDTVDAAPQWIAFLDTTPPGSLKTYRELAGEAIGQFQVAPVVSLVELWKTQSGQVQAAQKQASRQQELQRQIAPTTTKASSAPAGEKVWTRADYEYAYDPRRVRDTKADALLALQAEADRAVAEGRVRW